MTLIMGESDEHTQELVEYYKQRLETSELEFQAALEAIDQVKISHEESHRLSWEVLKRTKEVNQLQQALGDFQAAVFEERKHTLKIVAENDALKIQELKDRKKIRFLLSLSGAPEEEVTYFRERLDKRLVKVSRVHGPIGTGDLDTRRKLEEQELLILEDEVEALKLTVSSLQTQVDEQKDAYENAMAGLLKERRLRQEEDRIRREYDEARIESLMEKLTRMRTLCRENTRELLRTKKVSHSQEKLMAEEKATLKKEIKVLSQNLVQEQERNETAEKTIETRVVKKQDSFVSDMKNTIKKLESELKATKEHTGKREVALNQKIEYLKSKFESVNANYLALKKRRDYEIEGFTSDIINLRNQLRLLEKSILKYGSLEDKEMVLLNLARLTGERASKISRQLQNIKTKVYNTEQAVQSLEF
ncbi:Coiled-coil domain-containing protein 77 [Kappamyces sp. JEL0829]|nr:Coiled-coil domain-containing protein 77 [Kappamyces sp. JEL0829]